MTSLDKIERGPIAAPDFAAGTGHRLSLELTETLKLAVPLALTQLGQIAMMTTDLAFIGRLGDGAVAAAALAHTIFFVSFTVGMGLNTGEVVMGNLGSADRLNYTVIGDNVNTAARLYNVAKGGQTIISESTYEEVKDRFIVNELTPVFVKGKTLPLRNFEIVGLLAHPVQHQHVIRDGILHVRVEPQCSRHAADEPRRRHRVAARKQRHLMT